MNSANIVDFDLYFADGNPSGYVGLNEDFISSARLDNLFSSFHGRIVPIQLYKQSPKSKIQETSLTLLPSLIMKNVGQSQRKEQDQALCFNRCIAFTSC